MAMIRCLQPLESSEILGPLRFGDDGNVFMIVMMITTMMIIDCYDMIIIMIMMTTQVKIQQVPPVACVIPCHCHYRSNDQSM